MSDLNHLLRELTAERDRLRQELAALETRFAAVTSERDRLRGELTDVCRDRDQYLRSLHVLMREDFTFTPEQIAVLDSEGIPLSQVIEEIERTAQGASNA
jgi:hypothetical protein